ncbi:MAG: HD domain-containing phosphohydrolase [Thermodesulfobacteriota bacterium]
MTNRNESDPPMLKGESKDQAMTESEPQRIEPSAPDQTPEPESREEVEWIADPSDIFLELDSSDLEGLTMEYTETLGAPEGEGGGSAPERAGFSPSGEVSSSQERPAGGPRPVPEVSIDFGLFTELLQNLAMPVFLVDPDGCIVFANQAVSTMGSQFEQLGGQSLKGLFDDPERLDHATSLVYRALRDERPLVDETMIRVSGSLVEATIQVRALKMKGFRFALISLNPRRPKPRLYDIWKYKRLFSIFPVAIGEFAFSRPVSHNAPESDLLKAVLAARLVDGNNNFARAYGKNEIVDLLNTRKRDLCPLQPQHTDMYLAWIRKFFPSGTFEIKEAGPDGSTRHMEVTLVGEVEEGYIVSYWELRQETTHAKTVEQGLRSDSERMGMVVRATVEVIGAAIERKDPRTARHQRRVAALASAIAREMDLSEDECLGIHVAASLHDIGKVFLPADLLAIPRYVTDSERAVIQAHPSIGFEVLRNIKFPWPVAQMVLQHHERMDGSGYPAGLTGASILMGARIIAVADVFEAMCSDRPHRPANSPRSALCEIRQENSEAYDPQVVRACSLVVIKGLSF